MSKDKNLSLITHQSSIKKNFLKIVLLFVSLLSLLLISEILYSLNSGRQVLLSYYLNRANYSSKYSNPNLTLKFLARAAKIKLIELADSYPKDTIEVDIFTPNIPDNYFQEELASYLNSLDYNSLAEASPSIWGKYFYNIGLIASKNGESAVTADYWQIASYLAPEWSYFHIELANYYIHIGSGERAKTVLEYCLNFKSARQHCSDFFQKYLYNESAPYENLGFLQEKINEEIKK